MKTKKKNNLIATALIFGALASGLSAQDYSANYVARLSSKDHHNSSGAKLTSVAAILRQDRANYHKYNKRDKEDQTDQFFTIAKNRGMLEKYFNSVYKERPMSQRDKNAILNGNPLVRVSLVDGIQGKKYLSLKIIGNHNAAKASNQAEMNDKTGNTLKTADKELNLVYKKLINRHSDDPTFKAVFQKAQRAWLKYVDLHMESVFPLADGENPREVYGSSYPAEYAGEKIKLMNQRIVLLKSM